MHPYIIVDSLAVGRMLIFYLKYTIMSEILIQVGLSMIARSLVLDEEDGVRTGM